MHRRPTPLVLAALALLLTGCQSGGSGGSGGSGALPAAARPSAAGTAPPAPAPGSAAPAGATPGSGPAQAAPAGAAAAPASPRAAAAPSYDVAGVQRRLAELKYYGGDVDGAAGPALASAVLAFQKVQGMGADGSVGPATLAALTAPRAPQLAAGSPGSRVEVDLSRQVLYVVAGGSLVRVLPISSGNGATYGQKDGTTARALTPVGWYRIERRYYGAQEADLGTLYDPQYFYRGWAIHGSDSVPAVEASHGCVRVTRADATWLLGQIGVGTSVYLYGGAYTFTAGSSAPGTDAPTGDGAVAAPTRTATPPAPARTAPTRSSAPTPPAPAKPQPAATPPAATPPAATLPVTRPPATSPAPRPTARP